MTNTIFFGTAVNENGVAEAETPVPIPTHEPVELKDDKVLEDINTDSKESNGGLGPEPSKPLEETVTIAERKADTNQNDSYESDAVAWGRIKNGALDTLVNVEKNLLSLMQQFENFSLKCKPLKIPTEYGSTHVWEFSSEFVAPTGKPYADEKILSIIPNATLKNEFAFSLTSDQLKPFLFRNRNNKIWLKLRVDEKKGLLILRVV